MKYFIIGLVCLISGYFLYPAVNPKPVNKFEEFVNAEAKKFADATDADSKLKAAEEMYGKMMVLFLAELGLKVKQVSKPVLNKPFPGPEKIAECPPLVAEPPSSSSPDINSASATVASQPQPKTKPNTPEANWIKYTTSPFLESFRGADRRMLGRFEGTLVRGSDREDSILMVFNLTQRGKDIEGETQVTMTDPSGKVYSNDKGNGGNRSIKKAENGYYIEASPTSYFEVNLKHYPQISGKYFERGKFVGDVTLRKTGL